MNATHAKMYLWLAGILLIAVGGVNVGSPPPGTATSLVQGVGVVLILSGIIGFALSATFGPQDLGGLTDSQQRSLVLIANLAIGLGGINTATLGLEGSQLWVVSLVVVVLGVVGHAIQQQLGSAPKTVTALAPTASTTSIGA